MRLDLRNRWAFFVHRFEQWGWLTRWMFQSCRAFSSYRRYKKTLVVKTMMTPVQPPAPEEAVPVPGLPPQRPVFVEQSKELIDAVAVALFGVRDPSKRLRNVKLLVNYEDGTTDSWSCEDQVAIYVDNSHGSSTITLTSLEA